MSSSYERACIALGKRIQERRERMGFTRTQFGEAIGVSRTAVRRWEQGAFPPHHKHILLIAKVLKMEVGELSPFADVA